MTYNQPPSRSVGYVMNDEGDWNTYIKGNLDDHETRISVLEDTPEIHGFVSATIDTATIPSDGSYYDLDTTAVTDIGTHHTGTGTITGISGYVTVWMVNVNLHMYPITPSGTYEIADAKLTFDSGDWIQSQQGASQGIEGTSVSYLGDGFYINPGDTMASPMFAIGRMTSNTGALKLQVSADVGNADDIVFSGYLRAAMIRKFAV